MEDWGCRILHYGKCGEMVRWTLDSENTMHVYGYGAMDDFCCDEGGFEAYSPWEEWTTDIWHLIVHSGITAIGNNAWRGCLALREVELPEGLRRIGAGAFEFCLFLPEIRIPASVRVIRQRAFRTCFDLTSIDLPSGLDYLGGRAFQGCFRLRSIKMPVGLRNFDAEDAFQGCSELRAVAFPKKLTCIPRGMFEGCTRLGTIVFRGGAVEIDEAAFEGLNLSLVYPAAETSWTEDRFRTYGGTTFWANYFPEEDLQLQELLGL